MNHGTAPINGWTVSGIQLRAGRGQRVERHDDPGRLADNGAQCRLDRTVPANWPTAFGHHERDGVESHSSP
jgi:hypothetical protein